ncbi:23555_t:CDS:2, partial [Gigaspora margarita]
MDPFIYNEQSSPSPITLASPIQNSAVSIDSNITEIDNYIDAYCSSKNFSKIIYSAEYDSKLRRHCHYRCEFQGQYRSKKKMIAKEQCNTRSKRNEHENHPLDPLTNKFGTIYRTLTEPMLADIEFWTTKGNLSISIKCNSESKKEQQIDDEVAILINYLLECKAKDTRWIVNWRVDLTNNSLVSLFWIIPDQYELYVQYNDVVQYNNIYSTNQFKIALGLLLIVDNNNWSHIVGQMLMNDETYKSFEWAFCSLVQATNIFPSVIITDNDLAIDAAIEKNSLYAKFHIMLIPRRWYKTKKQLEDMSILCQQPFTDSFQESSEETVYTKTYIELPYKVANISYKRIYKSLNQRKEYITDNGLSKKAIQMGLDAGPSAIQELNNIMKNYI